MENNEKTFGEKLNDFGKKHSTKIKVALGVAGAAVLTIGAVKLGDVLGSKACDHHMAKTLKNAVEDTSVEFDYFDGGFVTRDANVSLKSIIDQAIEQLNAVEE